MLKKLFFSVFGRQRGQWCSMTAAKVCQRVANALCRALNVRQRSLTTLALLYSLAYT